MGTNALEYDSRNIFISVLLPKPTLANQSSQQMKAAAASRSPAIRAFSKPKREPNEIFQQPSFVRYLFPPVPIILRAIHPLIQT
jgi:hypothetical protein